MANNIEILIERTGNIEKQLKETTQLIDRLGKETKQSSKESVTAFKNQESQVTRLYDGLKRMLGFALGAGGFLLLINKVKNFTEALINASAAQEEIFKKLETAVNLTGISYEKNKERIDAFLSSMQATTRYGDTDVAPALQRITQLTGSLEKGFEGAKLAADIASSGLFDLTTASTYVSMAMSGEVTMLGRYIPELKATYGLVNQNMTATEKWAIAKDLLNKKFAGAAQKDLDTYSGSLNQLKNYLGDIGEKFGDILILELQEEIKEWTKAVKEFIETGKLDEWAKRSEGTIKLLVRVLSEAASTIKWISFELDGPIGNIDDLESEYEKLKEAVNALKPEVNWFENIIAKIIPGLNAEADILTLLEYKMNKYAEAIERVKATEGFIGPKESPLVSTPASVPTPDYTLHKESILDYTMTAKDILGDAYNEMNILQEIILIRGVEIEKSIQDERLQQLIKFNDLRLEANRNYIDEWINQNQEANEVLRSAYQTFQANLFREDMTGSQKRIAIMKSMYETMTKVLMDAFTKWIANLILKQTVETTSSLISMNVNLKEAAAKIFSAHAEIPFVGTAIASGFIAQMYATMAGLTSLQSGSPYIPRTGLYMLHQGEAVIPREQNTIYGGTARVEQNFNFYGLSSKESNAMVEAISTDTLREMILELIEQRKL